MKAQGKDGHPQAKEKEASGEIIVADTLILDFWPSEMWENKSLLFKPPRLWYFGMVA